MNTFAYILYFFITYLITVHAGLLFYRNGRIYLLRLFHDDQRLTGFVNRMLLTGYYLLNLGYAALMLRVWKTIETWAGLLVTLASLTGRIMLTLALIHFLNMAVIFWLTQRRQSILHTKNIQL